MPKSQKISGKKKSRIIPGRYSDLVVVQTFARVIDKETVVHKKETEYFLALSIKHSNT